MTSHFLICIFLFSNIARYELLVIRCHGHKLHVNGANAYFKFLINRNLQSAITTNQDFVSKVCQATAGSSGGLLPVNTDVEQVSVPSHIDVDISDGTQWCRSE